MSQPTNPPEVFQDVDESLSRTISFAHDLNGSTVSSIAWTIPAGLTNAASSNTTTTATIRLSATTTGTFKVICTATLANSEVLQTHFTVTVTD
jgi:hypothetical protein